MKKYNYLMLALCIASSLNAADIQDIQQKMNIFDKAVNNIQKEFKLYRKCFKRQCTPQEKAQVHADLKTAAKIAIPTGIALITAVGLYKYRTEIKMAKWYFGAKIKSKLPHAKKTAALEEAINNHDDQFIKQELDKGLDPRKYTFIGFPFAFYVLNYGTPEMLQALINKHPEIVNEYEQIPLLTEALRHGKQEQAKILLATQNINVRPSVEMPNYPLFQATNREIRKRILAKYTKQQLEEDVQKIKEYGDEYAEIMIKNIKKIAAELGMVID